MSPHSTFDGPRDGHSSTGRRSLSTSPRPPRRFGLPIWAIIALALLAAPRVVLHDLGIIREGTAINALFVVVPLLVWVLVTLWARVPNAFLTLLAVGIVYGIVLAVGHQLFWIAQFDGAPPRLGGRFADLDPGILNLIVRGFAAVSSLLTGTAVGTVVGLLTWGLDRLRGRGRKNPAEAGLP